MDRPPLRVAVACRWPILVVASSRWLSLVRRHRPATGPRGAAIRRQAGRAQHPDPDRRRSRRPTRSGIDGDPHGATPEDRRPGRGRGSTFRRAYCNCPGLHGEPAVVHHGPAAACRRRDPAADPPARSAVTLGDWLGRPRLCDRRLRQDALQLASRRTASTTGSTRPTGSGTSRPTRRRAATIAGPGVRSTTRPPSGSTPTAGRSACRRVDGGDLLRRAAPPILPPPQGRPVRPGRRLLRAALAVQVPRRLAAAILARRLPAPRRHRGRPPATCPWSSRASRPTRPGASRRPITPRSPIVDSKVGRVLDALDASGPGRQHDRRLPRRQRLHAGPARPVREALLLRAGRPGPARHPLAGPPPGGPRGRRDGRAGRPPADPARPARPSTPRRAPRAEPRPARSGQARGQGPDVRLQRIPRERGGDGRRRPLQADRRHRASPSPGRLRDRRPDARPL